MKTPINRTCEKCGRNNLKNSRTVFPVIVAGRQMNIGRVSVRECIDCYSITPTKAGLEKIERCTSVFMDLLTKTEKK